MRSVLPRHEANEGRGIAGYVARRASWSIVQFVLIAFLLFAFFHLAAGDQFAPPGFKQGGEETDYSARLREEWRLDRPLVVRFGDWFQTFVRGGFGASIWSMEPPDEYWWEGTPLWASETFRVADRMAWSLVILGATAAFVGLAALLLGALAALHPGSVAEGACRWTDRLFSQTPGFLLALGLLLVIAALFYPGRPLLQFDAMNGPYRAWPVPAFGAAARVAWQCLIAWIVIALPVFARAVRRVHTAIDRSLESRRLPLAARGVGGGRILSRHAVRPALPALVKGIPGDVNLLIGGAVLAGELFGLPTFGAFYLTVLPQNAHAGLVLSCLLWYVALALVVRLACDVTQRALAPRNTCDATPP